MSTRKEDTSKKKEVERKPILYEQIDLDVDLIEEIYNEPKAVNEILKLEKKIRKSVVKRKQKTIRKSKKDKINSNNK